MNLKKLLTDIFHGPLRKNGTKKPPSLASKEHKKVAESYIKSGRPITPTFTNLHYTWKLTEEQKEYVCQLFGQGLRISEVRRVLKEVHNVEIGYPVLYNNYLHGKQWSKKIKQYRDEYLSHSDDVPGFHKKIRIARMERVDR